MLYKVHRGQHRVEMGQWRQEFIRAQLQSYKGKLFLELRFSSWLHGVVYTVFMTAIWEWFAISFKEAPILIFLNTIIAIHFFLIFVCLNFWKDLGDIYRDCEGGISLCSYSVKEVCTRTCKRSWIHVHMRPISVSVSKMETATISLIYEWNFSFENFIIQNHHSILQAHCT